MVFLHITCFSRGGGRNSNIKIQSATGNAENTHKIYYFRKLTIKQQKSISAKYISLNYVVAYGKSDVLGTRACLERARMYVNVWRRALQYDTRRSAD